MGINKVGIAGSGIMASGIAEVAAASGCEVVVRSRQQATADQMAAGLDASLAKQVERGKRTQEDADALRARVRVTTHLGDLADCDLVIESVVESLDVKLALFRELDDVVKQGAILATNTSTLPVVEMAMVTKRPELVCGVHFFNPAPMMSLVEVVRPLTAADSTIEDVTAFAERCGKEAVVVKDQAGFIVNTLLFGYLNHAVGLLETGVANLEGIDAAMKGGCGFPMGPFALLDLVGLDTSLAILEALYAEFAEPRFAPQPRLKRMVAAGLLGRKTKRGFYDYRR
jgi:3-hydroxybutyryl-CoA dehydrogenase